MDELRDTHSERMTSVTLGGRFGGIELCQAMYRRHQFPVHAHPEVHLALIESGRYVFNIDKVRHVADADDVVILGPDVPHDGGPAGTQGFSYRQVLIPPDLFQQLTYGELGAVLWPQSGVQKGNGELSELLMAIFAAYKQGNSMQLDLLFATLAVRLAVVSGAKDKPRRSSVKSVQLAMDMMLDRYDEQLTVAELAEALQTSRFTLSRSFRHTYGIGIHEWLMGLRLRQARRYLSDGMLPAEAAAACGFADQSHLARRFKSSYGVPPGQFRKLPRNFDPLESRCRLRTRTSHR